MNALQILISETMANKGLRKAQIVALLGFKNITRASGVSTPSLRTGLTFPACSTGFRPPSGFPPRQCTPLMSRRSTRFGPRLRHNARPIWNGFEPSSGHTSASERNAPCPSPIFVVAMTGGPDRWLRISLPEEITALPEHSQIEQVAEIIRQHHAEHKGWAGPFGSINGYYYRSEFERAVEFSVTGQVVGPYFGPFPVATCRISV